MKKTLIAIALNFGHRIGYWDKAASISSKASTNFSGLIDVITPYVTIAHDMVEAGHDIAMAYPPEVMVMVHTEFADDWSRFIRGNERLPTNEESMDMLRNVMRNGFGHVMSSTQMETYNKKLMTFAGVEDE